MLAVCTAFPASAQNAARLPLVGVLRINTAANNEPTATMLHEALAALGDVVGRDLRIEFRLAEGDAGRLPELAEALVRDGASIIVANGSLAIRAAQRATRTIPIVATTRDLVTEGFITSLARPAATSPGSVC
jgi:putative ABC transport system substrate-binding protein